MSTPPPQARQTTAHPAVTVPWVGADPVHDDLRAAKTKVYDPSGFECSRPFPEPESADYCAHSFLVNGWLVRFRAARTTSTKVGQFVTLWARSASGPIRPLDTTDPVDLVVISSRDPGHFGHFVFPVDTLSGRGIVSVGHAGGKRGFRVYPPWTSPTSRQAAGTQAWQLDHFLTVEPGTPLDVDRARVLYRAQGR